MKSFYNSLGICLLILVGWGSNAQVSSSRDISAKIALQNPLTIDSVSIDSQHPVILKTTNGDLIPPNTYIVDYSRAELSFLSLPKVDSVVVNYTRFPSFLTNSYQGLDSSIIVENSGNLDRLYTLKQSRVGEDQIFFEGLTSSGSLSRGLTIGNNQNGVLNSNLDLKISGKLNENLTLRASIQDANIPIQDGGYSKRLDDFDQIFIEFESAQWRLRGGDIDISNRDSEFVRFSKRIQGISFDAKWKGDQSKQQVHGSAALAKGQFARSPFRGIEGNQGPYKLKGDNGELYVLIISGSETIYVNGVALERGEDKDYVMDYNAGEIRFTATFPITSDMRIVAEYQYSDRNFTRFVTFNGGSVQTESLDLKASIYMESDLKNQPLQQNLTESQKEFLTTSGDGTNGIFAPSEEPADYDINRILYRKIIVNGIEVFEYSNNPDDQLFAVKFTEVGTNQGNYQIAYTDAIAYIYAYVPPADGVPQGNFEPVVKLIAPLSLKLANVVGDYQLGRKTKLDFDVAASQFDQNLYSKLNDNDNKGFAGKLQLTQKLSKESKNWQWNLTTSYQKIDQNFKSIENLNPIEFSRDWDLQNVIGNREFLRNYLTANIDSTVSFTYAFENLKQGDQFEGQKHRFNAKWSNDKWKSITKTSILNVDGENQTRFLRVLQKMDYKHKKVWGGVIFNAEDLHKRSRTTLAISPSSNRYQHYNGFVGVGDSLGVYGTIGYRYHVNDSLYDGRIQKANKSSALYFNSTFISNSNSHLSLFANYRKQTPFAQESEGERTINARLQYRQNLVQNLFAWQTLVETSSGQLPQQGYTFVEVEPGQGTFTWIDYNGNGIQELEEFEIANFQDQGTYVRLFLPHQVFVKTQQQVWRQSLTLNPKAMSVGSQKGFLKKFYNLTSFSVDRKAKRNSGDFNFDLMDWDSNDVLALDLQWRNSFHFNRDEQKHNSAYYFVRNRSQNLWSTGLVRNDLERHQLRWIHQLHPNWVANVTAEKETQKRISESYSSRNFELTKESFSPNLSYNFDTSSQLEFIFEWAQIDNQINAKESLNQQQFALNFSSAFKSSSSLNAELRYIKNDYSGQNNTPVAYQLLEGLQTGENWTWSVVGQQKLTKTLDLNVNYFGRKTADLKTIHTGSIQLRANF